SYATYQSKTTYTFGEETLYETHRGILRLIRRLFNPLLKLLFNPNPLIQAIHKQTVVNQELRDEINTRMTTILDRTKFIIDRETLIAERDAIREKQRVERREMDALYYEIIHNLVLEMTRVGVENKNLKMRM